MAKKGKTRSPKSHRKSHMTFNVGSLVPSPPGKGRHASKKPHAHR